MNLFKNNISNREINLDKIMFDNDYTYISAINIIDAFNKMLNDLSFET